MSVKININADSIKATIDQTWETGLEMISSQILKDCNEFCKEDTGMLIISSYIHSDLKKGVWSGIHPTPPVSITKSAQLTRM